MKERGQGLCPEPLSFQFPLRGVGNRQIILGDARLTGALLDILPEQYRAKVRQCLASLDRVALTEMDLPTDVKGYALELIDLRGKPKDVLSRLANSAWTSGWISGLTGEINYLKSLIDLWESTGLNSCDRLILDLSFMQTFDYYTGIVFEVACKNYVVAQGGRYDQQRSWRRRRCGTRGNVVHLSRNPISISGRPPQSCRRHPAPRALQEHR